MENVSVSLDIIKDMIEYIADNEVDMSQEVGACKNLKELIEDDEMPRLYSKLCSIVD